MMTLDIIIPSHRREYRIREMAENWINRSELSGDKKYINVWIACEYDDQKIYSERLLGTSPQIHLAPGQYGCYVEAVNTIASQTTGDVLIAAADDVVPGQSYDCLIEQAFKAHFSHYDGVIRANDMIHDPTSPNNTHPIIGRKYYEAFGYVYYPGYFALYADEEFAYSAEALKRSQIVETISLEHQHHTTGKTPRDFTHERPLSQNPSGERLFQRRKQEGFPVWRDGVIIPLNQLFEAV